MGGSGLLVLLIIITFVSLIFSIAFGSDRNNDKE